jgi:hypothetical protein
MTRRFAPVTWIASGHAALAVAMTQFYLNATRFKAA